MRQKKPRTRLSKCVAVLVSKFFDEIRTVYVNDPNGRRFTDGIMRTVLMDSLNSLYGKYKRAFYGKYRSVDLAAMENLEPAAFGNVELNGVLSRDYHAQLRDTVWEKLAATQQRGQVRGAPLQARQRDADTPSSS